MPVKRTQAQAEPRADKPLWTIYDATINIPGPYKLCASVPADQNLIATWIEARKPKVRPPGGKSLDEINEEVVATLIEEAGEEEERPSGLIFQRVDGFLHNRAGTIRAHIKECARTIGVQYVGKIEGERAFSTRVINAVYLDPARYWIPILTPDGQPVSEATGRHEKPVHARGPRGQMLNSLKIFEYVSPARLDFRLHILGGSVTEKELTTLLQYGGVHGYGGERSDGEGRYTFTLRKVEGE